MYKFSPAGVSPYVHDIILTLFHGTYATFKKRGHNMYSWVWALSSMSLWTHLWWCSLILWVSVVLLRTVVIISDWDFDKLGRSHHQSDNDCDQDPSSHHQSESSGGQNISYYQWQSFSGLHSPGCSYYTFTCCLQVEPLTEGSSYVATSKNHNYYSNRWTAVGAFCLF